MNEHSEILPLLAAFHDGALTDAEQKRLSAHLETCSECRQLLTDWQALDRALGALDDLESSTPDLVAGALAQIRRQSDQVSVREARPHFVRRPIYWAAAAAVLLLAAAVVFWPTEVPRQRAETGRVSPAPEAGPEPRAPVVDSVLRAQNETKITGDAQGITGAAPGSQAGERLASETGLVTVPAERAHTPERPEPTAPVSIVDGDSGIPHFDDWPARLFDSLDIPIQYRLVETLRAEIVEINLVPAFEADFVGVSYSAGDLLARHYDISLRQPIELSPELTSLVSDLRLERTALMARSSKQVLSAEVSLRLAEITWRLANLTADPDDVQSAISAQRVAMRQKPALAPLSKARLEHLKSIRR
jgi:anti-sigma factor RsiW